MQKGTNLNVDIPNGQKFQLLAIDNSATEAELKLLIARYNQDKAAFTAKLDELASMRTELAQEENRPTTNDFDEGERRQRVLVLTEKIKTFVTPLPPSAEVYHVQRAMLEMKLKESASINASLLIWQAKKQTN